MYVIKIKIIKKEFYHKVHFPYLISNFGISREEYLILNVLLKLLFYFLVFIGFWQTAGDCVGLILISRENCLN